MKETSDLRLIHHHAGGRNGETCFNWPKAFERDVVRVLYDADAEATAQAEAQSISTGRTTIVRPYFVGSPGRKVTFQINYCPYTSSAYDIDPRFAPYHTMVEGADYVLREVTKPIRTVEIESHGLDDLVFAKEDNLPVPDILSLDTQGGEGDILAGAQQLLGEHVVAIVAEVMFNPVYVGAPFFGDISAMLRNQGFLFVEFDDLGRYAPMRGRLGTRGLGLVTFGDAVFFKDPARVDTGDATTTALMLRKLAFVALCRGQLEFAQTCLARLPADTKLPADAPTYLRFVDQFQRICALAPDVMPWSYAEAYSAERNASGSRTVLPEEELRRIIVDTRARAVNETSKVEHIERGLKHTVDMVRLFQRYGLDKVADVIAHTQKVVATDYVFNVTNKAKHG